MLASLDAPALRLNFGLSFDDLYRREGLLRLDELFVGALNEAASGRRGDGRGRSRRAPA